MLEEWKNKRAAKRVAPGDGSRLGRFRWWHHITGRKLGYLHVTGSAGRPLTYAVDVRTGGEHPVANLYVGGYQEATSRLPALFTVDGGSIHVALSSSGLKRFHFVDDAGQSHHLEPDAHSAAGRRVALALRHPRADVVIAWLSVIMLVVGVGLNFVQIIEPIANIPPLVERFGHFESPIHLPLWLNVVLALGAAAATTERSLRLRHHWLLDSFGA
ncbi:MAG TPA: hypothetical protein K8V11_01645 [Dietzia timorensis]|uniref:Uncharacterized protein n=1 Tax=Dietzia timorensis TaxID=499555 RepID=A0A921F474_9ACTN|nr:hypothetical protein [Dietzia timorensis]HJE89699.1 hypothetical protein [Dietzia timorensis]